jgi:hypothetical protein
MTWLVERLADAGYQKLKRLVAGSDYERELKEAAEAAVQATASEISPSDKGRADKLAELISGAFGKQAQVKKRAQVKLKRAQVKLKRAQVKLLPRQLTRREGLYAAIAQQLSVLDDAGRPPGVPVSEVAARLGYHLVEEIKNRGAQGGPLAALASQLNHDEARLQGQQLIAQGERLEDQVQRIEGTLAELLGEVRDGRPAPDSAAGPVGWPLAKVDNPFALEVHHPVEPDAPQAKLPVLPVYFPREHDAALAEVVTAAAAGKSGIAVLVGGSSTGKTRACWQALELLRDLEPEWQLWHPIDPSPPQAALAGLRGVGPRTVVWLNEAQRYLDPADGTGERVAAGLRDLLRNPGRGPVVVLATLWPQPWNELTARPPEGKADPRAQARELLADHNIRVPDAFTDDQMRQLEGAGDPRLVQAAGGSRDGQVIQYLAGAPDLLNRYRNAPPAVRALIDAAMDARRLGMGPVLPRSFLEMAAPGYLTGADRDLLAGDWLERALKDTAKSRKGVRGPLAPILPGHAPGVSAGPDPARELADYLDQHGRRARRGLMPPASFWAAAASCADPADLGILAAAAYGRGLYRDAARLNKQACRHGDPVAAARLVNLLWSQHPGDRRPARWAAAHARLDDPRSATQLLDEVGRVGAARQVATLARRAAADVRLDDWYGVAELLHALRGEGATRQVARLARRAAAHVRLDDPNDVAHLLHALRGAGATRQVTGLLDRNPAAHARLDNPDSVSFLLGTLLGEGATRQVTALLDRNPGAHVHLGRRLRVGNLLITLREAGATWQATTLATRAAAQVRLDDPDRVAILLNTLVDEGATRQVTALLDRNPAAHARLGDPDDVASLLGALRGAGAPRRVTVLLERDPAAQASLGNPYRVVHRVDVPGEAGAAGQITALLDRDPAAHARLDNPYDVANLLDALGEAGATGQATTLATRAAAHGRLDDPGAVARLLDALRRAGATSQVAALLDRDPAGHARLDDPGAVARLLDALRRAGATAQATTLATRAAAQVRLDDPDRVAILLDALGEAGATGQATTLATRAAAHADLDDPDRVAKLLDALRAAGAQTQATELVERLPAAGMFDLFCSQPEVPEVSEVFAGLGLSRGWQFPFGREADGRPAKQWGWTDLG